MEPFCWDRESTNEIGFMNLEWGCTNANTTILSTKNWTVCIFSILVYLLHVDIDDAVSFFW